MRTVSPEIKAKILDLLNKRQEPQRSWDIANALGYSQDYTRAALAWLVHERSVERIKPRTTRSFNSRQARTSTGFDENYAQPSFLYRLPDPRRTDAP